MRVSAVSSYTIDDEDEADAYLRGLLAKPEYRSVSEVDMRAYKLIPIPRLRAYFINKAKVLKAKEVLT